MPGRDFDNGWDSALVRFAQGKQTVTRPAVEQIVAPRSEVTRRDPVEIFLFRAVIIGAVEKREEPHWVPAKRINLARRNLGLPIIIRDRLAEKSAAMGCAERFESIRIQSRAPNPRKN